MKLPENDAVLVLHYPAKDGELTRELQGKLLFNFMPHPIVYRDIYKWTSTLWKTRNELGDKSLNIDASVFKLALNLIPKVKEFHYFDRRMHLLYTITTQKLVNALKVGDAKAEELGGHCQLFVPYFLWTKHNKPSYDRTPWVKENFNLPLVTEEDLEEYMPRKEIKTEQVGLFA